MAFNWGGGAAGGLGGAASGATIGSFIPGFGTAIGAGVGGIAGLIAGGFSKDKPAYEESPNKYSPEQQKVLSQLLQQGQSGLKNPYAGFQPIEDYARSKFQRESLPGLAERFTALGGSDTRGSSDFAGMLGGAQSEFDQGLAALRAQYGHQGQQNAIQQLQLGLNPQTEQIHFGRSPGVGNQILETSGSLVGQYLAGGGDFGMGAKKADDSKKQLLDFLKKWKAGKGV